MLKPFLDAHLAGTGALVHRLLNIVAMLPKNPALYVVPTPEERHEQKLERMVGTIVRRHFDRAHEKAWTELARRCDHPTLLAADDPVTGPAAFASRELVTVLTDGVMRLVLAALVPPQPRRSRRRRSTRSRAKLAAIPGGIRRDSPVSR